MDVTVKIVPKIIKDQKKKKKKKKQDSFDMDESDDDWEDAKKNMKDKIKD